MALAEYGEVEGAMVVTLRVEVPEDASADITAKTETIIRGTAMRVRDEVGLPMPEVQIVADKPASRQEQGAPFNA